MLSTFALGYFNSSLTASKTDVDFESLPFYESFDHREPSKHESLACSDAGCQELRRLGFDEAQRLHASADDFGVIGTRTPAALFYCMDHILDASSLRGITIQLDLEMSTRHEHASILVQLFEPFHLDKMSGFQVPRTAEPLVMCVVTFDQSRAWVDLYIRTRDTWSGSSTLKHTQFAIPSGGDVYRVGGLHLLTVSIHANDACIWWDTTLAGNHSIVSPFLFSPPVNTLLIEDPFDAMPAGWQTQQYVDDPRPSLHGEGVPKMENPLYIGEWKRRLITNPYPENTAPWNIGSIGALQFELDFGVFADNLFVGSLSDAKRLWPAYVRRKNMDISTVGGPNLRKKQLRHEACLLCADDVS